VEAISAESTFVSMSPGEFGMTVEQEAEFVEECRSAENCLYLVARSEDQLVGGLHFGAKNRRRVRHVGEFGMSVRKEFWGQVIGAATLGLLIEWGRLSGVVTKINLRVRTDNARAIGLYESRGFEREGTIRRDFMVDGEYFDHHLMGLIV
jgi:RimJ/RimL family protein N-acetyltransferase